jgi:hypothetical protein
MKRKKTEFNTNEVMAKAATALLDNGGEGFVMHMNNGTAICRSCVTKDIQRIFDSLRNWSRDNPECACFADIFTKDTAGSGKCARCNEPFKLHVSPLATKIDATLASLDAASSPRK